MKISLQHPVKIILLIALAIIVAGCSTMPAFGPSSDSIMKAAKQDKKTASTDTNFKVIDISPLTLPHSSNDLPGQFPLYLINQPFFSSNQQVIPSDVISIRIWEAADDGLFASSGQRETIFNLTVSNEGSIDVPYAGSIPVSGKSVHEIREILLERYRGKAIDPEINVEINQTYSRGVSVLGNVSSPGRIPVPAQGIKLLDLIALAGGVPHPAWEVNVKITRQNGSAELGFIDVLSDPHNNIVVLPNDNLQVTHLPRRFAIYGAIRKPGNVSVNAPVPRLSDVLAESGGLNDMQAEASSVFVFRPNIDQIQNGEGTAIAYRLNFAQADAFLLASQLELSPSDIIYIATADASEFRKFATSLLSPFLGSASSVQNIGN